jgi:N6-adenosine-specific RNA methylase IME4
MRTLFDLDVPPPSTAYATILADPAWKYDDEMRKMKSTGGGAATKYNCLSISDIAMFLATEQVRVADDAYLWLWTTNSFMDEAHDVARAWGFVPKTIATWVKGRLAVKDGSAILVQHICQGRHLRNSTEHVILAARGKPQRLAKNIPTSFVHPGRWKGRKHSEKPPVIHEWAERFYGGPRIELFARGRREGWDAIGDELGTVIDGGRHESSSAGDAAVGG